ncbi:hypothetical protein [Facilibium subflavum]|uniref:hypothetical protein n=1 Tax=Facilibium subflavum TaxID=2219058 RepID=UPI000E65597E|nr:hypothetical protein [Facilibium subflavum]
MLQLPQKPDYVTGSTLAKVTVKRDNTAVASIDNIPWGGQTTIPVSFVGSMASFNVSVEPLEGGQGIATPSSFSLTDGQTKQVSIYYEAPPERVYGSLNVNVSTIGSIPTTMPSYTVTNTQGETVLSGSLYQGDSNLGQLLSSEGGLSYTLYVPDFIENGNRYTVQGGNTRYFVIQPNQTTSLSLIYDRQAISQDKPYPLQSLENQYNNWLLVNTGSEGLIKGGYQAYTSEGIAFQVLIGAGMLVLDPDNAKAKTSIQAVYGFIYSQGNSRLVNGLLPWAFDDNLNVLEEYSATDADIMLARGFYLAGEVLDNQAYKAAALDMMEAIYEYDTTNLNGAVFLNQGGRNAGSDRNKPVDGIAGMAYSKTLLSSLDEFSKVDTDRSSQWQSVIQNTLNAMRVAQLTAMSNNSNWGGVLGFIRQGVPGAAYFRYENSNFLLNITGDASLNTFDHWNFNYDVGRIPLILGKYTLEKCASETTQNCQTAKTILSDEMGGQSSLGINGVFFDYQSPEEGYKVYLPDSDGQATYAAIFENNQPQPLPDTTSNNAYSDDFLNASFLMGNLGNTQWQSNNANPATTAAIKLMSSASGGYYGGAYKLLTGLSLDGAFNQAVALINKNDYVDDNISIPARFDENTRVVLQQDSKADGYYYIDYLVSPAVMVAGQHYDIKVIAEFPATQHNITRWESQSWGSSVITLKSQGGQNNDCAIFEIATDRPDYQTIGLIGVAGSWATLEQSPVLTYAGTGTQLSC